MKLKLLIILILFFGTMLFSQNISKLSQSEQELLKQKLEEFKKSGTTIEDKNLGQIYSSPKSDTSLKTQRPIQNIPINNESFLVKEFKNRKGANNLFAFGYNVFGYIPETFLPYEYAPVPKDYIVGPGDEIIISLWGEIQAVERLTISADGNIYYPNVGLIYVSGKSISQLYKTIFERLSQKYASLIQNESGSQLDVSVGKMRAVKIYVLGDVKKPGGYLLPAMSSSFTALYFAGGPTLNGTLRNIKIVRNGKLISTIDFYDYLTAGDNSKDIRLQDEDIVFIPNVGERVAISGEIKKPAIYEIKNGENLSTLFKLSGGLNYNAYFNKITIERIVPFDKRNEYNYDRLTLDLHFNSISDLLASKFELYDGDYLNVGKIDSLDENRLYVMGEVKQPGISQFTEGMKLNELIEKAGGLKETAFADEALLFRLLPNRKRELISVNLKNALKNGSDNILLRNLDSLVIFNEHYLYPVKFVEIDGQVKNPGRYLRFTDMHLTDLISLAGGFTDSASISNIEITRTDTTSVKIYSERFKVNIPKNYWEAEDSQNVLLADYDRVLINVDPRKIYNKKVTIVGEVFYPGTYTILNENERFLDIVERAGGVKETAYKEAIYIKRKNPIFNKIQKPTLPDSLIKYQGLFKTSILEGFSDRIPINCENINGNRYSLDNIPIEDGDSIFIPRDPSVIYVLGEVGIPATVRYKKGASLNYYLEQAGGYTSNSDRGNEIVILPNGRKWNQSGWFFIPDPEILSGSTIMVPTIYEIKKDAWPIIRDTFSIISSATIIILTVYNLTK